LRSAHPRLLATLTVAVHPTFNPPPPPLLVAHRIGSHCCPPSPPPPLRPRPGHKLPAEELARYESAEAERERAVWDAQLRHITTSAQVAKLEEKLKKREQVAEGLAMIDFEQLKIENSTLNEKIEDRNEELAKLRKKATVAVQVLTHVREKFHFVQAEAARLATELAGIDADVSDQRAQLAHGKKEREVVRVTNEAARHAQGFAHADPMAVDFERRKREVLALRALMGEYRGRYNALAASVGLPPYVEGGEGAAGGAGGL
jgi:chromosome segregation ATPase